MNNSNASESAGCGCMLIVLVFNFLLGGWSVAYLLNFFLAKDIPWYADMFIGLIVGEISVPTAVITAILRYFGAF